MQKILYLFQLIKFSHSVFALPFVIAAIILNSQYHPIQPSKILYIFLAFLSARASAMAFNRLADLQSDSQNPRTQSRHLPQKLLSSSFVKSFILLSSLLFFSSSYLINTYCLLLSPLALALLFFYSFWKKFSPLSHFFLGTIISSSVFAVHVALLQPLSFPSFFLFLASASWISGFDILYSLSDLHFDLKSKLHSLPASIGSKHAILVSQFAYSLMILSLLALAYSLQFSLRFSLGTLIIASLLSLQHASLFQQQKKYQNPIPSKSFLPQNLLVPLIFLLFFSLEFLLQ